MRPVENSLGESYSSARSRPDQRSLSIHSKRGDVPDPTFYMALLPQEAAAMDISTARHFLQVRRL